MEAGKAEVGKKYLSKTGIPVTVVKIKGDKVIVKGEASGNEVDVPTNYELKPYDESKINRDAKGLMKANDKKDKARNGTLAKFIDPILFTGGKTVKEIAAELTKKAGAMTKGKDIEANVRARMVSYTRKGWQVIKDDKKRVKVVQNKG